MACADKAAKARAYLRYGPACCRNCFQLNPVSYRCGDGLAGRFGYVVVEPDRTRCPRHVYPPDTRWKKEA